MRDNPARGPKRRYHHGDLRAALLVEVRGLIETDGPDGFSIAEAARRAGVSTGAPYKHFRDRDHLLHEVVADAMDRMTAATLAGREAHPYGSLEAVCGVGQAYIDFARAQPGVFRLMFGLAESHGESAVLKDKGATAFRVVVEAAARYLGLPSDDPIVAQRAYTLWAFVHGHAFLGLDGKHAVVPALDGEKDLLRSVGLGMLGPQLRG